jgi:hypothetical protein
VFGPSGPTLSSARLQRFEADRSVLAEVLPRLRHYIWASGEGAYAEGVVDVDVGAGCWEEVEIRMDFGSEHPPSPPRVYDQGRRWKPDPDRHLMFDFEFCLALAYVDTPDVTSIEGFREFLLRLVPFLRDQFVFDDIGRWPGPEWRHGPRAAYAQHLVERLEITSIQTFDSLWPLLLGASQRPDRACPCGSRLPYGRCHRRDIEALQWARGLSVRDEIPGAIRDHLRDAA